MNKDRVGIGWAKTSRKVQGSTDCTPVVGAVVDEMEKHLFTGHDAAFPVKNVGARLKIPSCAR